MQYKQRKLCNKVAPLSVNEIRDVAHHLRDLIKGTRFDSLRLNIAGMLDHLRDSEQIEFEIVDDNQLQNEYAVSVPNEKLIRVRQSVYHNAILGVPRDCFTLAHELGHVILHRNTNPVYARSQSDSFHHFTEDAEWQANTFASELLVDSRQLEGLCSPRDIANRFGVSLETAGILYERYEKSGIL